MNSRLFMNIALSNSDIGILWEQIMGTNSSNQYMGTDSLGTIYGNKKRRCRAQTSFLCGSPQFLDRGSIPLRSI